MTTITITLHDDDPATLVDVTEAIEAGAEAMRRVEETADLSTLPERSVAAYRDLGSAMAQLAVALVRGHATVEMLSPAVVPPPPPAGSGPDGAAGSAPGDAAGRSGR